MRTLLTLALLPAFMSAPAAQSETNLAELGGDVIATRGTEMVEPGVPITVDLFDGALLLTSSLAGPLGRYVVAAQPGDYWLRVRVAGQEAFVERVHLAPASSRKDLRVHLEPSGPPPVAAARF